MRIFKILKEPHMGRRIHVTMYRERANTPALAPGIDIKIEHDVPTVAGKDLQWVQTVSDNGGFSRQCGLLTRVDPFGIGPIYTVRLPGNPGGCKADDLLPFFWTSTDLDLGRGPGFADRSASELPKTGRSWKNFVTALTEVTGREVHHLVAITWGFDIFPNGRIGVNAIRRPTTDEMRNHGNALKLMYPTYRYT